MGYDAPNVSSGKVYNYGHITVWAEGGLIFVADERYGEFKAMSQADCVERAAELRRMLRKYEDQKEEGFTFAKDDYTLLSRFLSFLDDALHEAKLQGDPHNDEVARHRANEYKRKQTVTLHKGRVVSNNNSYSPGGLWLPPGT